MTATLTVAGADVSGVTLFDVEVETGRDNVDSQPDASVLSAMVDGWSGAGKLGDPVRLSDAHGQLFKGTLTDLQVDLDPTRTHPWRTRLTAVGPLADVGRTVVGDEPWPQETDSQRIVRILDLIGVNIGAINPGVFGPAILPRDVDSQPGLDLAQAVAADAFGVLWEQPSDPVTPIRYTPQRLRSWSPVAVHWTELAPTLTWPATSPATWADMDSDFLPGALRPLTLDASEVVADLSLEQRMGDLVRRVRVTWGIEPAEGEPRPQAILGDGQPEISRDTQLANLDDATTLADTLLRARRTPAWQMRQVRLRPFEDMTPARAAEIRAALAVGTPLTITRIDFDSPIGTVWQGYLEGWRHELADGLHTAVLNTSERIMTEPSDRWQDVDAGLRWQNVGATTTWDQTGDMP